MSLKGKSGKTIRPKLINFEDVKKAAIVIRAFNNPLRKRLIDLLIKSETASVTTMVINLREPQTVISQHLNILRHAKIVTFLKKGKNVYYFLDKSRMLEIQNCLSGLFEEHKVETLKRVEKI